jgi:hypothetical protein
LSSTDDFRQHWNGIASKVVDSTRNFGTRFLGSVLRVANPALHFVSGPIGKRLTVLHKTASR